MKNFTHLVLISLLLLATGCKKTEKDLSPQSGEVQFSMANSAKSNGVLPGSPEAAVPAFVLLSFTDEQGKAVVSDKKMALYLFGEDFVSEVLKLNTGNYKLSKFLVLDAGNKIIYASPLSGSPLAQYVSKPLPLGFSITANGSTLVSPQVLKVEANTPPESFGYASFGFEVVEPIANSAKLQTMFDYNFNEECSCFVPSSKLVFTYNNNGKISAIDTYGGFDAANGYKHTWKSIIEYFPGQSSLKKTTWSVATNSIQSIEEIYFNPNNSISSKKYFSANDYSGNTKLSFEDTYTYLPWGYTVNRKIYGGNYSTLKLDYEVNMAGNIIKEKQYDVSGNPNGEASYTYDNNINPLAELYPFLTSSESKHNKLNKIVLLPYYEETYNNVYLNGLLTETIMKATNGNSEKIIFKYY